MTKTRNPNLPTSPGQRYGMSVGIGLGTAVGAITKHPLLGGFVGAVSAWTMALILHDYARRKQQK